MEQIVRVHRLHPDGRADIILVRESACSGDCHKCSGCGAVQQKMIFQARNPIGARPGDLVTVESASGPVLKAAAMLYMLPLVLFIAGYLVGMQWSMGGLIGALAFALSIVLIVCYDRLIMKKKNTEYTIIGYAQRGHQPQ